MIDTPVKASTGLLGRVRTSPTAAVVFGLVAGAVLTLVLLDTFGLIRRPETPTEYTEFREEETDAGQDGTAPAPEGDPEGDTPLAPGAGGGGEDAGGGAPVRDDAGAHPNSVPHSRRAVRGAGPASGPAGS